MSWIPASQVTSPIPIGLGRDMALGMGSDMVPDIWGSPLGYYGSPYGPFGLG